MKTQEQVKHWMVSENTDFLSPQELKTYANSLDCALATLIYCEKNGIPCEETEERVIAAVKEPGPFWDFCLQQAKYEFREINLTTEPNARLCVARAVCIGVDTLIQGFTQGL